jgi:hypothetical protein
LPGGRSIASANSSAINPPTPHRFLPHVCLTLSIVSVSVPAGATSAQDRRFTSKPPGAAQLVFVMEVLLAGTGTTRAASNSLMTVNVSIGGEDYEIRIFWGRFTPTSALLAGPTLRRFLPLIFQLAEMKNAAHAHATFLSLSKWEAPGQDGRSL